jgi:uncharacterized protein (TIGR00299 family) protein
MTHLHLDPLGGIAGDMFAAALLDAFPEHVPAVTRAVRAAAGADCTVLPHGDGTLTGRRFAVTTPAGQHHHAAWRDIRAGLTAALDPPIRAHALGIFGCLAEAEARIHGVAVDDVEFHEVGATDSIADIVAAAVLIAGLGEATWSIAPLPLGSGRVNTAHGPLPVPAPATAWLLRNFVTIDDGIAGERVTPTGAAIVHYLRPAAGPSHTPRVLERSGIGFGTRTLQGISNCLRILVFGEAATATAATHRALAVIAFEVDDQTAEDLSAGLDRLRALPGVHDVLQMAAIGKKGRLATQVQVLARPDAAELVANACFEETTTIGLRIHHVEGRALARRTRNVEADGQRMRVKIVERPGGPSAKAESDDGLAQAGHAARAKLRRDAEQLALAADGET